MRLTSFTESSGAGPRDPRIIDLAQSTALSNGHNNGQGGPPYLPTSSVPTSRDAMPVQQGSNCHTLPAQGLAQYGPHPGPQSSHPHNTLPPPPQESFEEARQPLLAPPKPAPRMALQGQEGLDAHTPRSNRSIDSGLPDSSSTTSSTSPPGQQTMTVDTAAHRKSSSLDNINLPGDPTARPGWKSYSLQRSTVPPTEEEAARLQAETMVMFSIYIGVRDRIPVNLCGSKPRPSVIFPLHVYKYIQICIKDIQQVSQTYEEEKPCVSMILFPAWPKKGTHCLYWSQTL